MTNPLSDDQLKVFRVRHIPRQSNHRVLRELLRRLLSLDDEYNGLQIQSLAVDAIKPQTRVATICFDRVPDRLFEQLSATSTCELEFEDDENSRPRFLLFDEKFLGLTTLASPEEGHTVDIIAVSGLAGHAFGSFKQRKGDYMWLRDTLPNDLKGARIMIYGYDSHLSGSNNFQDLEAIGGSFVRSIQTIEEQLLSPKIFIGHSLGGLIIKEALILMKKWKDALNILEVTRSVLFFGVPNDGMDIESLIPIVSGQPNEAFLRALGPNSRILREQWERFETVITHKDLEIFCFYETQASPTAIQNSFGKWVMGGPARLLVSMSSAHHGRYSDPEAINNTHSNMVKFDRHDQIYNRVLQRLRAFADTNPTVRTLTEIEQECLRSLSFPEMNDRRHRISEASDETCQWIFKNPEFEKWQRGGTGLLWIKGKPGSGKSTLFNHVLGWLEEKLRHRPRHLILSFFFNGRGTELECSPLGLYRSLLSQLLQKFPDSFSPLVELYKQNQQTMGDYGEKWHWDIKEIQKHFEKALTEALKIWTVKITIDALDECGQHARGLVKALQHMASKLRSENLALSILFTCRHFPILTFNYGAEICTEDSNQSDIAVFVDKQFPETDDRRTEICDKICERAQGVFQWAAIVTTGVSELLQHGASFKAILEHIRTLPPELESLYEGLFNSLKGPEREEALRMMRCICFAMRPLTLGELRFAMVFQDNNPPLTIGMCMERADLVENDQKMKARLTYLSCGLAETQQSHSRKIRMSATAVQFIHQSVQDFFKSRGLAILHGNLNLSAQCAEWQSHCILSWACLNCIILEDFRAIRHDYLMEDSDTNDDMSDNLSDNLSEYFDEDISEDLNEDVDGNVVEAISDDLIEDADEDTSDELSYDGEIVDKVPFSRYAALSLVEHLYMLRGLAQESQNQQFLVSSPTYDLPKLGSALDENIKTWLYLHKKCEYRYWKKLFSRTTLLHIIAKYDLSYLLPNEPPAERDDLEVRTKDNQTPLLVAAENGNEAVVKLLLATGKVDVEARDSYNQTPLIVAVTSRRDAVVKLLLEVGKVDVEARDSNNNTPLLAAVAYGSNAVVKLLLATGKVDVEARDNYNRTPLSWAARRGDEALVKLLLDTGKVDMEARDKRFDQTPLSMAAENGHEAVVKLLLATGKVNVEACDFYNRTPLLSAAENGHSTIVKLLLATGKVDVEVRETKFNQTPLSLAAERGHGAAVKLLLATCKVDVEARDNYNRTPLSLAAERGCKAVVKLLLATGKVDLEARDNYNRTPLSWAARYGHKSVVRLLIATGKADLEARDKDFDQTPLSMAAENGHGAVVKLLLATGKVDVEARDKIYNRTPLSWAAQRGDEALVKFLLDTGKVDVEARGYDRQTPLSLATEKGHEDVVKLLLATSQVQQTERDV